VRRDGGGGARVHGAGIHGGRTVTPCVEDVRRSTKCATLAP
jgi:hypothetical protein